MEAHRSVERFEHGHRADGELDTPGFARQAALVVAVMAALLAIATFLSNEAVKEVITGETHRADTSSRLESNQLKIDVAAGDKRDARSARRRPPRRGRSGEGGVAPRANGSPRSWSPPTTR